MSTSTSHVAPSPADPSGRDLLPSAAPGFPALVRLHLRMLVREFPVAWIVTLAMILFMGVMVARVWLTTRTDGAEAVVAALAQAQTTGIAFALLLLFLTLLWPEAVWRHLPPGERGFLDTMPVSRRSHRLARVVAGAALPFALIVAIGVCIGLLRIGVGGGGTDGWPLSGSPLSADGGTLFAALGALATVYLVGSVLALRLGRVLLPVFLFWALAGALFYLFLIGLEWRWGSEVLRIGLFEGAASPGMVLSSALAGPATTSPLATWGWAVASFALTAWVAGGRR